MFQWLLVRRSSSGGQREWCNKWGSFHFLFWFWGLVMGVLHQKLNLKKVSEGRVCFLPYSPIFLSVDEQLLDNQIQGLFQTTKVIIQCFCPHQTHEVVSRCSCHYPRFQGAKKTLETTRKHLINTLVFLIFTTGVCLVFKKQPQKRPNKTPSRTPTKHFPPTKRPSISSPPMIQNSGLRCPSTKL